MDEGGRTKEEGRGKRDDGRMKKREEKAEGRGPRTDDRWRKG